MDESPRACDSERLEQYVAGRLNATSRDALEQHILDCPACAEELQLLTGIRDALPARRISYATWLSAIAALIALAVAAGVFWNRLSDPAGAPGPPAMADRAAPAAEPDLEALARFTPPPYVSLQTRTADSAPARLFESAMADYNAGRYDRAADELADVIKRDPDHDAASVFFGISALAAGRPAEAIAPLRRVSERNGPQSGLARLMLGRAYLRMKDLPAARRELETLAATSEAEAAQARELLKALPAR